MAARNSFFAPIPLALAVGFAAALTCGCDDDTTPADFVGIWRFVEGEATVVLGAGGESDTEVNDVAGDTFEIELGTGGVDLHLILEGFEDCRFDLETTDNWAAATAGANGTCHFVDQPAEYNVNLQGALFGINESAGTGAIAYALSGTLTFDGDMGDYRVSVIGSVEKEP